MHLDHINIGPRATLTAKKSVALGFLATKEKQSFSVMVYFLWVPVPLMTILCLCWTIFFTNKWFLWRKYCMKYAIIALSISAILFWRKDELKLFNITWCLKQVSCVEVHQCKFLHIRRPTSLHYLATLRISEEKLREVYVVLETISSWIEEMRDGRNLDLNIFDI